MKRHVTIALVLVFLFGMVAAPVYAGKAGEIKDDVYIDADYGFSFNMPPGWSAKIKKSKSPLRMMMEEKSAVPPPQFQGDLRDYMQIPTIKVLADTTSMTVEEYVDKLLDSDYKSKQKKFFIKNLSLISKPHEIQTRSNITLGGSKAIVLNVRQAYMMEVSQRGSDRANVINDHKTGAILVTVRDGNVIIIHMICEFKTSGQVMGIFDLLLKSLKFNGEAEESTDESSG